MNFVVNEQLTHEEAVEREYQDWTAQYEQDRQNEQYEEEEEYNKEVASFAASWKKALNNINKDEEKEPIEEVDEPGTKLEDERSYTVEVVQEKRSFPDTRYMSQEDFQQVSCKYYNQVWNKPRKSISTFKGARYPKLLDLVTTIKYNKKTKMYRFDFLHDGKLRASKSKYRETILRQRNNAIEKAYGVSRYGQLIEHLLPIKKKGGYYTIDKQINGKRYRNKSKYKSDLIDKRQSIMNEFAGETVITNYPIGEFDFEERKVRKRNLQAYGLVRTKMEKDEFVNRRRARIKKLKTKLVIPQKDLTFENVLESMIIPKCETILDKVVSLCF